MGKKAPVIPYKTFLEEIKANGHVVRRCKGTHFAIEDNDGNYVSDFCLPHGGSGKSSEIGIPYVKKYRRAVRGEF